MCSARILSVIFGRYNFRLFHILSEFLRILVSHYGFSQLRTGNGLLNWLSLEVSDVLVVEFDLWYIRFVMLLAFTWWIDSLFTAQITSRRSTQSHSFIWRVLDRVASSSCRLLNFFGGARGRIAWLSFYEWIWLFMVTALKSFSLLASDCLYTIWPLGSEALNGLNGSLLTVFI